MTAAKLAAPRVVYIVFAREKGTKKWNPVEVFNGERRARAYMKVRRRWLSTVTIEFCLAKGSVR